MRGRLLLRVGLERWSVDSNVSVMVVFCCFLFALHKVEFCVDDDNEMEKMRLLSSALKVWVTTVLAFFQRMCRFL
jgi:hypothetical protein